MRISDNPLYSDANFTHYYKLQTDSTDGKGASNGTDSSVTYIPAKYGNGAKFVYTDTSHITYGQLISSNDFSISLWTKKGAAVASGIFNQGCDFGTGIAINSSTTQYLLIRYDTTSNKTAGTSGVTPSTTTYDHLVAVSDTSAGKFKLYVNGVEKIDLSIATTLRNYANGTCIGSDFTGAGGLYDGVVDDVGIWSRVLTPTEVLSLYKEKPSGAWFLNFF